MKIRVGVIFGGESVEHEISIISANQAIHALDVNKYDVLPIYISKKREFYIGKELFDLKEYKDLNILINKLEKVNIKNVDGKVIVEPIKKSLFKNTNYELDVIIPVVHGTNGEDGVLQGYLELLNIPYSSSNVVASAVGQDKAVMKSVLKENNISIVDWFWVYAFELDEKKEYINKKANEIGFPLILKPANLGSSIGIEFANNIDELYEAIEKCGNYDEKVIIEKKIESFREINCSVLGTIYENNCGVLEEVNMGKKDELYDFGTKYTSNKSGSKLGMASTNREIPAKLSKEVENEIYRLAKETFRVVGASGVCRIDFIVDDNNKVYVNEINNIPGSLAFYLWQDKGIDFSKLMDELVNIAFIKKDKKDKKVFSFDSNVLSNFSENAMSKLHK